jgi:hypothetical protein
VTVSHEPTSPTFSEARDQLATSYELTGAHDRRVHAITTALLGVALGAPMGFQNLLVGPGGTALRTLIYAVIVGGALVWAERTARTVPRHAKLASRVGFGASLLVGLTMVLPWLNFSAQSQPNTVAMAIVGAVVIASPSWIAAGYIARARR